MAKRFFFCRFDVLYDLDRFLCSTCALSVSASYCCLQMSGLFLRIFYTEQCIFSFGCCERNCDIVLGVSSYFFFTKLQKMCVVTFLSLGKRKLYFVNNESRRLEKLSGVTLWPSLVPWVSLCWQSIAKEFVGKLKESYKSKFPPKWWCILTFQFERFVYIITISLKRC